MSDTRRVIKKSEIEETYTVCPFCMEQRDVDAHLGCCGESSSHFVEAHEMRFTEEVVLDDDVVIDDDWAELQDLPFAGEEKGACEKEERDLKARGYMK